MKLTVNSPPDWNDACHRGLKAVAPGMAAAGRPTPVSFSGCIQTLPQAAAACLVAALRDRSQVAN